MHDDAANSARLRQSHVDHVVPESGRLVDAIAHEVGVANGPCLTGPGVPKRSTVFDGAIAKAPIACTGMLVGHRAERRAAVDDSRSA
jgi:hypothetical protein